MAAHLDAEPKMEIDAPKSITICGHLFASPETLSASIIKSRSKTETYTLADHLKKIDDLVTVFKLQPDNLIVWCKKIASLVTMTDTACAFLPDSELEECGDKAVALWTNYWVTKLKEAAPTGFKIEAGWQPATILYRILSSVSDRSALQVNTIACDLWSLRAKPG